MMNKSHDLDRRLILATQNGLPLVLHPYAELARQLNCTEEEIILRMQTMRADGRVRRIAAVPNHYALGYRYNGMTVWNVDDGQVDRLGHQVGQLAFVSHCYRRPRFLPNWPYNLFAMIHAKCQEDINGQAMQMLNLLNKHCHGHDILYSSRILKKTGLRLKEGG